MDNQVDNRGITAADHQADNQMPKKRCIIIKSCVFLKKMIWDKNSNQNALFFSQNLKKWPGQDLEIAIRDDDIKKSATSKEHWCGISDVQNT